MTIRSTLVRELIQQFLQPHLDAAFGGIFANFALLYSNWIAIWSVI